MNNSKLVHPNRRLLWSRLAFPLGVSFLFVAVLLWGFGGAATAHADFPVSPAMPQNGTVTVASGDPIEIALVTYGDWNSSQYITDTVQMAINDYGTIKGWSLQRNDYDGGSDTAGGENAANVVVSNTQNVGVIGPDFSSSTAGALPVLETAGVVMISHASTGENLPPLGPTVFNRVILSEPAWVEWDAKISRLPSVRDWETDFESTFGHPPGGFSKFAYDASTLLLTHIDAVSSVDGGGNLVIDRAALAAAVRSTSGFPGVTDDITLETDGDRVNSLSGTGTRYIATGGSDSGGNDCSDSTAPCASVGRGTALADDGGNVLVAQGTYTENVTISGITLTLRGGYTISGTEWMTDTGETVIDGNDNGRVFFIHGNDSTLEYLTITGGKASDPDCWGGGLWVTNGDVTLRHVVITNNQSACGGGGIAPNDDYGPVSLMVEDSLISDNKASDGGAMASQNTTASFSNVLISGNKSGVGGVFAINGGDITVMNSTIAYNQADQAVLLWSGILTITNSIMYENALNLQADPPCTDCFVVTYSNIQGGDTSNGNIDEDPMFVDPVSGDYSLKYGSACIDTGTDSGAPDHDLANTERPLDGDGDGTKVTDMGTYEFVLHQLYLPITVRD